MKGSYSPGKLHCRITLETFEKFKITINLILKIEVKLIDWFAADESDKHLYVMVL